jgi:MYXO-CTERM domain-containing protein
MKLGPISRAALWSLGFSVAVCPPTGVKTAAAKSAAQAAPVRGYIDGCSRTGTGPRCDVKVVADDNGVPIHSMAGPVGGWSPADLESAYGLPLGGGSGRIVAVFGGNGDVVDAESNLAVYRAQYGLPPCTTANGCFMKIDEHGGTSYPAPTTDELEQNLDLDMVSAACPACRIMFVEGGDLDVALATVKSLGAAAFSFSILYTYGSDGTNASICQSAGFNDTAGLLVTAAMGDNGYPSVASWIPAVCQGVVAVGGTSLSKDSSARGWSESAWTGTGSGCSDAVAKPSWQSDQGCTMRMGGDISAVADLNTPVSVYDGGSGWILVGGTSAAAPLVAAALTNTGVANGHFSPAWIWQHTGVFNDVTTGSNGTCAGQASYVCNAGPGYDGPTGWGTPNGPLLMGAVSPYYAAQFVGQSFPLAVNTTLTMVEGQVIPSYIELKNIGTKTWDAHTRLATTQPRDRNSAFADATWVAPNRPAGVQGTVPPGGTYKLMFDLTAPRAGSYDEFFGVVEEGVAWFSDPGQGGPADNFLEVKVNVVAPQYRGTFKDQSFPLSPAPLTVNVGDVVSGYIELTNSGTQTWKAGVARLAPIPRDVASPFADPSWIAPIRVSTLDADVPPGAVGRFPVKLDATTVGDKEIELGLVEEHVTWFADAPLGGGPADGSLKIHLVVLPKGTPIDAGAPGLDGGQDGGWFALGDGGEGSGGPVAPGKSASHGCGCSIGAAGGGTGGPLGLAAFLIVIAIAARRKSIRIR